MGDKTPEENHSGEQTRRPELQWQASIKTMGQSPVLRKIKSALGHVGIILALAGYTALGGFSFIYFEHDYEEGVHNESKRNMNDTKVAFVADLWEIYTNRSEDLSEEEFSQKVHFMLTNKTYVDGITFTGYDGVIGSAVDSGINLTYPEDTSYNWEDPWKAIFFSATVITTIGYGNIAPVTVSGRVFCICYAFIGIPLTLIAIADMGKIFATLVTGIYKRLKKKLKKKRRKSLAVIENMQPTTKGAVWKIIQMCSVLGLLMVYISIGGAFFMMFEEWTFFESFYFCFITMTTIGLGDLVPEQEAFLLVCTSFYILLGLAVTSTCIEIAQREYQKSWQRMVEASKKFQGLHGLGGLPGLGLADTLKKLGEQLEKHGDVLDANLIKELKTAIKTQGCGDSDRNSSASNLSKKKPPPIIIYESSV